MELFQIILPMSSMLHILIGFTHNFKTLFSKMCNDCWKQWNVFSFMCFILLLSKIIACMICILNESQRNESYIVYYRWLLGDTLFNVTYKEKHTYFDAVHQSTCGGFFHNLSEKFNVMQLHWKKNQIYVYRYVMLVLSA